MNQQVDDSTFLLSFFFIDLQILASHKKRTHRSPRKDCDPNDFWCSQSRDENNADGASSRKEGNQLLYLMISNPIIRYDIQRLPLLPGQRRNVTDYSFSGEAKATEEVSLAIAFNTEQRVRTGSHMGMMTSLVEKLKIYKLQTNRPLCERQLCLLTNIGQSPSQHKLLYSNPSARS